MKPWLFYSLAFAVVAGIVLLALSLGERAEELTVEDVRRDGFHLSGADLVQLVASPGTEVVVGEGMARAVMVSSRAGSPPSAGVFATLIPAHEAAFSGRPVEMVWRIRRPAGAGRVELGYFTLGGGDTGWRTVEVGEEWTDATLTFTPGATEEEGYDYAGLWPGVGEPSPSEKGADVVEIESVTVRLADP